MLLGALAAAFAAAVEGRVGPATLVALVALGVGGVVGVVLPVLYGSDAEGVPRFSRTIRFGVPIGVAVVAGLWSVAKIEGRIGPATLAVLGLLVVGAVARVVVPVLYGSDAEGVPSFSRALRLGVPITLVVAVGLGAVAAGLDGSSPETVAVTSGGADDEAEAPPDPSVDADQAPAPAPSTTTAPSPVVLPEPEPEPVVARWDTVGNPFADPTCAGGSPFWGGGGGTPRSPLDGLTQGAVDAQLDAAQAFAVRFPTVAHAEFAGYQRTTDDLPCAGAHYVKWNLTQGEWGIVDGTFDPAQPEILLYDGTNPNSPMVGVGYLVVSGPEPAGFAGGNEQWHRRQWMCLTDGVVEGVGVPLEGCTPPTQIWLRGDTLWMSYAWVAPGDELPHGVFANGHRKLA